MSYHILVPQYKLNFKLLQKFMKIRLEVVRNLFFSSSIPVTKFVEE